MPNRLYMSTGTRFDDATEIARVGHLQKGHGVAMADFDGDGDLDIFERVGGFVPGDKFYDTLFENPATGTAWLKVLLQGQVSNRPGLGARIHVLVREGQVTRSYYRFVSTGGSFGDNPFQQHFGLGHADEVLAVEVDWPRTGQRQRHEGISLNRSIKIVEGEPDVQ